MVALMLDAQIRHSNTAAALSRLASKPKALVSLSRDEHRDPNQQSSVFAIGSRTSPSVGHIDVMYYTALSSQCIDVMF